VAVVVPVFTGALVDVVTVLPVVVVMVFALVLVLVPQDDNIIDIPSIQLNTRNANLPFICLFSSFHF
jgi:hypothetical protein